MTVTYTQNDLDIALLEQRQDDISETMREIKHEIKAQFHLLVGLILGIYGIVVATALAKIFGAV